MLFYIILALKTLKRGSSFQISNKKRLQIINQYNDQCFLELHQDEIANIITKKPLIEKDII